MWSVLGAVGLAVLAAVLAVALPRLWVTYRRRSLKQPLTYSLSVSNGPLILYPAGSEPVQGNGASGPESLTGEGTALGWQTVRLTLRGPDNAAIVVKRFDAVVLSRGEPSPGWFQAPELGGGQALRLLVADLESMRSPFLLVDDDAEQQALVQGYVFQVSDTDPVHVELEVFTVEGTVQWGIDVHFDSPAGPGTLHIRDERLEVAAEHPGATPYVWEPPGQWEEADWGRGYAAKYAERWRSMTVRDR